MDHPVTVRTQKSEVAQLGTAGAGDVQRNDVVTLNEPAATLTVGFLEIKSASLACNSTTKAACLFNLAPPQVAVTFPGYMAADQQSPLASSRFVVLIVDCVDEGIEVTALGSLPKGAGLCSHLAGPGDELGDDPLADVCGVHRRRVGAGIGAGEIEALAGNVIGIAKVSIAYRERM
jgi:hypothetical protein